MIGREGTAGTSEHRSPIGSAKHATWRGNHAVKDSSITGRVVQQMALIGIEARMMKHY